MKPRYPLILLSIALVTTALVTTKIHADMKVFKSTDLDGRVTYSDKPTEKAIDFEIIEITPTIASNDDDLDKRLERMAATTKRLQDDRKGRESKRQEQGGQNTVVYYPAAYPPANYGRVYRSSSYLRNDHRANNHPGNYHSGNSHSGNSHSGNSHPGNSHHSNTKHYRAYQNGSDRLNNYHRKQGSVSLGVGFRSSHLSGSLQVGNRQSLHNQFRHDRSLHNRNLNKRGHDRQFAYSPLRKNLRPRAPSPYTNARPTPRNSR